MWLISTVWNETTFKCPLTKLTYWNLSRLASLRRRALVTFTLHSKQKINTFQTMQYHDIEHVISRVGVGIMSQLLLWVHWAVIASWHIYQQQISN